MSPFTSPDSPLRKMFSMLFCKKKTQPCTLKDCTSPSCLHDTALSTDSSDILLSTVPLQHSYKNIRDLSSGPLLTLSFTANYDDPLAKERDAPPEPVPIQFPEYVPAVTAAPLTAEKHDELKKLVMQIRNPADVAAKHIEAFNVKYRSQLAISDLIPDLPDGLIDEAAFNTVVKDDFSLDNDLCFRKVCRLPPEKGQTLPRLAHAYLFYKNLEDMSRYWDNSKDDYFEKEEKAEQTDRKASATDILKLSKERKNSNSLNDANGDAHMTDSTTNHSNTTEPQPTTSPPTKKKLYTGRRTGNANTMPPHPRDGALEGLLRTATQKFNAVCKPAPAQYTRLQIGELLIPVRQTFVVGRVPADRAEARKAKTVGPLMIGSARHEVLYRKDGERRGAGQGEVADFLREVGGLLLLAQQRRREGRAETKPGADERCWWATKARWGGGKGGNMPHEESAAVEEFPELVDGGGSSSDVAAKDTPNGHTRAKRSFDISGQGGEPVVSERNSSLAPSLSKTTTVRELLGAPSPTSPTAGGAEPLTAANAGARVERPPISSRRVKAMCEAWKSLKPPSGLWDANLTYQAIGKVDGVDGEWDDVFMMSAVNTHVSVLRMRVSRGYLDWLESGTMSEVEQEKKWGRSGISLPRAEEKREDWTGEEMKRECVYVERTCWWNLFVPEERCEALRGIWTVLSWLSREVGGGKAPWQVE